MCEWSRTLAWPILEAASLKYDNQFFTYVTISCGNQATPWVLVDKWTEAGLGYSIPALLGWSMDGQYVYFYDAIIPDGCQPIGGFQQDLRQVDLATGSILSIPISWTGGIALSADTTRLIYYDRQKVEVGVYDLASGEEQRFSFALPKSIDDWFAGDFTWSPDGQSALFIIQYGDPCFPTGVSVRRVDLQRNETHDLDNVSILLERQDTTLSILEWAQAERVMISMEGDTWWLYPDSGNLDPLNNQP